MQHPLSASEMDASIHQAMFENKLAEETEAMFTELTNLIVEFRLAKNDVNMDVERFCDMAANKLGKMYFRLSEILPRRNTHQEDGPAPDFS